METTVTVYERVGQGGVPWPISFVLPLPRGAETGTRPPLCLYDDAGEAVPIQMRVMSRWWHDVDQSIRLLEITFVCPGLPAKGSRTYTLRRGNPRTPAAPVGVVNLDDFSVALNGEPCEFKGWSRVIGDENGPIRARDSFTQSAGERPGLIALATRWAGIAWTQLDLMLTNNRFDRRAGKKFRVQTWTLRGTRPIVYQNRYSNVRAAADGKGGVDLLWDYDLHDMAAFRRRVMIADDGVPSDADRLTFLEPPVAVVDAETYRRAGQGAWPFTTFPAARDAKPVLQPAEPKDFTRGHQFFRLQDDKTRWYHSHQTGGWPYPTDRFVATGSPAWAEVDFDLAVGETTLLPQAVYGYDDGDHGKSVGLDEAPYGGGSWRSFYEKKDPASLSARDSQHGWHYHVHGAWQWSADPILEEWLKGVGQMRIAELSNRTPYPSDSARALGHSLALGVQSYEVDGAPDVLAACRARLRSLSNGWYKNANRSFGLGFGGFKDGYLCRAVLALMENLGPDDPDYWLGLQWIARTVDWNRCYGNFPYQISTSAVVNATQPSKIESLTLVDVVSWYAFEFSDRAAWVHLKKYLGAGLGKRPTGKWDNWVGQFEGRHWLAVQEDTEKKWNALGNPLLTVDDSGAEVEVRANLPAGTTRYCLLYARRPIPQSLDPATGVQNWWAAPRLRAGTGSGEIRATLEKRTDGQPWNFAVWAWGPDGRGFDSA